MAVKTYSGPGMVKLGGAPILELSSAMMDVESGNSDVDTLSEGYAGDSVGLNTTDVSGDGPIPIGGMEINWPAIIAAGQPIELGFDIAGQQWTLRGYVRKCTIKTDRKSPNNQAFQFHGKIVAQPS